MKSAGNMLSASRGTLSASGNNGSVLDTISSASVTQSWSLDTLGNMASVTTSGTAQSRSHNSRNQITALASATTPAYDSNGAEGTQSQCGSAKDRVPMLGRIMHGFRAFLTTRVLHVC
jgi:hypothetical protein